MRRTSIITPLTPTVARMAYMLNQPPAKRKHLLTAYRAELQAEREAYFKKQAYWASPRGKVHRIFNFFLALLMPMSPLITATTLGCVLRYFK